MPAVLKKASKKRAETLSYTPLEMPNFINLVNKAVTFSLCAAAMFALRG